MRWFPNRCEIGGYLSVRHSSKRGPQPNSRPQQPIRTHRHQGHDESPTAWRWTVVGSRAARRSSLLETLHAPQGQGSLRRIRPRTSKCVTAECHLWEPSRRGHTRRIEGTRTKRWWIWKKSTCHLSRVALWARKMVWNVRRRCGSLRDIARGPSVRRQSLAEKLHGAAQDLRCALEVAIAHSRYRLQKSFAIC